MFENRERPLSSVPRPVVAAFVLALAAQVVLQAIMPGPTARAVDLPSPPSETVLRATSLGEPIAVAQWTTLYLQAFDNQPGISIPFRNLDYGVVQAWLAAALRLDPNGQYPLLMATQLYGQVNDAARQRSMLEFTHREFTTDPGRRWPWLAHAAIMAKHRLRDTPLALRYARDIAALAPGAPNWARQMHIFFLEDLGEFEAARILLGGLLASGQVTDVREIAFLTSRLEQLKSAENSSSPTKK